MYEEYGRDAAINDGGRFTDQGYIYNNKNTFTEWYNGRESDIPKEYKVMSFPQAERPDPSKVEMDAAAPGQRTAQSAEQPQEPRPVIPIVLTSEKPAEKLKEITDRLEQGITELFDSERYKEYLRVMSNSIITASTIRCLSPCRSRTLPLWRAFPLGRIISGAT